MTIAPAFRKSADVVGDALSAALGVADYLVGQPLTPGAPPQLRHVRPGEDLVPRIADALTAIDEARRVPIEGGNPVGEEASLLLLVLMQLERARRTDRPRAERFAAIAHELRAIVRGNLARLLERRATNPTTTETGRNG